MKYFKTGRITLAILFIFLGFVILFKNIIGYKFITLCRILWPFIVILFGIELIVNNIRTMKDEKAVVNTDLVSITILSVITIFIMVFPFVSEFKKIGDYRFQKGYRYKEVVTKNEALSRSKKIIIDDKYSDIIVGRSDESKIFLDIKTIYEYNDMKHKDTIKQESVKIIKDKDAIVITGENDKSSSVVKTKILRKNKYKLKIPKGVKLDIVNSYGSIKVEDIESEIYVDSNYSDLNLEEIKGNIELNAAYGKIKAENISGDLSIRSKHSKNIIKNVLGELFISSNSGNIDFKTDNIVKNNIEIYCDYGNINMEVDKSQEGKFNIITTYGNIYDELDFDIMEGASNSSINETRKKLDPKINIRISKGNIKLKPN